MVDQLVDGDLAALGLLRLRNDNAENTVFHAGANIVLIDADWEAKRAREFPHTSLRDPVLGFGRLRLGFSGFIVRGIDRCTGCFGILVFDCGFLMDVAVCLAAFCDCVGSLGTFDGGWGCTGAVGMLGTALDSYGLYVGEFDFDVLLLDARKLSMEFIRILEFFHVEFGIESLHGWAPMVSLTGILVVVKIVEESKQRSE